MEDLTALFCSVDNFWKQVEANWTESLIGSSKPKRGPNPELPISEMMTIRQTQKSDLSFAKKLMN